MPAMIDRLSDLYVHIWSDDGADDLNDGRVFTPVMHERNERELVSFVDLLSSEASRARRRRTSSEAGERRVLAAFGRLAVNALGWDRSHVEHLATDGFRHALGDFPSQARRGYHRGGVGALGRPTEAPGY